MMTIWCDGGVSPNPGKGKVKMLVEKDGSKMYEQEWPFEGTNNEAEFHSLIRAMSHILDNYGMYHGNDIEIMVDSQNVVSWMDGSYKVRAQNIKRLHKWANSLLEAVENMHGIVSIKKTTHDDNKAHPDLDSHTGPACDGCIIHRVDAAMVKWKETHLDDPKAILLNPRSWFRLRKEYEDGVKYVLDAKKNLVGTIYKGIPIKEVEMDHDFVLIGNIIGGTWINITKEEITNGD